MTLISEVRERFLVALAREVDPQQIAEIHFFSPIRQGGVESGVAVVVVHLPGDLPAEPAEAPEGAGISVEAAEAPDVEDGGAPLADNGETAAEEPTPEPAPADAETAPPRRFTVHTARYRLVLKGPDRGRWETNVTEEADAPLLTVETVVRGVQRRAGDLEDPERMAGATVREILGAVEARRAAPR